MYSFRLSGTFMTFFLHIEEQYATVFVLAKGRYCHSESTPDLLQLFYTHQLKRPKESSGRILK